MPSAQYKAATPIGSLSAVRFIEVGRPSSIKAQLPRGHLHKMGRGGRVIYKKAAGRRRNKVTRDDGDDSEDGEYIAEEEEEDEESFYESDASEEERLEVNGDTGSETPEEISDVELVSRRGFSSRRRRSRVSDYEEEEEEEEESYMDDEDFSPDADEEDLEGDSLASGNSGGSVGRGVLNRGGKKRKRSAATRKAQKRSMKAAASPRKKRRRMGACSGDEGFVVKGRVPVERYRKETRNVSNRKVMSRLRRKKRSLITSEKLDPDYLTSDDDFVVRGQVVVHRRRNSTQVRKNANFRKRKKRSKMDSGTSDTDFMIPDEDFVPKDRAVVGRRRKVGASRRQVSLESEFQDFDDGISKSEIRDLGIQRGFSVSKPESSCAKKGEGKGKEKESDDLGKQLCGICLSEEQTGTVQGILNCCSHFFCLACIVEWSKVESRCPLCKRRFITITKSSRSDPKFGIRRTMIRVQKRDQVHQPTEEELRALFDPYENVVCLECQQGGDDNLMLLCDICDSSAHTYCVGLGRDVPEGNWYCDCCRPASEDSLHFQVQDAQMESSSHVSHASGENNTSRNLHNLTNFQRLVSFRELSSSQGFDLNVSPKNVTADNNDGASVSLASGAGASTLFGRRAIRQRIRFLLSNSRPRQLHDELNRDESNSHAQAVVPVKEPNSDKFHVSEKSNPDFQLSTTEYENIRHCSHSTSNSAPSIFNEANNFRHVEGAKQQVQSMVKHCLQDLSQGIPLERSSFKEIARKATHTILAACGIQHRRSMVSPHPFQPPNSCFHDLDGGPVNLIRGCCSSCFTGYVKSAVKMLV